MTDPVKAALTTGTSAFLQLSSAMKYPMKYKIPNLAELPLSLENEIYKNIMRSIV